MDFLAHFLAQGAWLGIWPPAWPAGRSGQPSTLSSLSFYIITTGAPRWREGLARGDSGEQRCISSYPPSSFSTV